jgi:uncharacterized membrane protein YgdD (TMEM256/DUF423 family)
MAIGVGCGAFGAHALRDVVSPGDLQIWEKAVLYQLVHGLAALVVVLAPVQLVAVGAQRRISALLLLSILVFSGSLYVLVLSGQRWLGMITPLGGTGFIVAWLLLAFQLVKRVPESRN